jgi:hypothetical protein
VISSKIKSNSYQEIGNEGGFSTTLTFLEDKREFPAIVKTSILTVPTSSGNGVIGQVT